jgi:hypothetical protein
MTDTQQQPDSIPKEYREALEAFVKRIQKRALAVSVDEPVQVPAFHYTNADGVRGILQSKAIWLTDILHLNDPSELKFGMDPARARLHEHLQKSTNELAKRFLSDLDLLITKDVFDVFGFYVASFSLDGDHLDQWRAYADNGRGYCIEFSKSIFTGESLAANPAGRVLPVRIEYGRDTIENAQKLVIDEVVIRIRNDCTNSRVSSLAACGAAPSNPRQNSEREKSRALIPAATCDPDAVAFHLRLRTRPIPALPAARWHDAAL